MAQKRATANTTNSRGRDVSLGASEAVRIKLLGGFSVSAGARAIPHGEWRLKKTAALVKLLALAPAHRLHREQLMELLWPDSGRKAASNSFVVDERWRKERCRSDRSPSAPRGARVVGRGR